MELEGHVAWWLVRLLGERDCMDSQMSGWTEGGRFFGCMGG